MNPHRSTPRSHHTRTLLLHEPLRLPSLETQFWVLLYCLGSSIASSFYTGPRNCRNLCIISRTLRHFSYLLHELSRLKLSNLLMSMFSNMRSSWVIWLNFLQLIFAENKSLKECKATFVSIWTRSSSERDYTDDEMVLAFFTFWFWIKT